MSFTLSCKEEVLKLLCQEASESGVSATEYITEVLNSLSSADSKLMPGGNTLQEIEAYVLLCGDKLMPQICELAKENKRHPVQQILCLVEIALADIPRFQLSQNEIEARS